VKKLLLAGLAFGALMAPAVAADLPVKAPVMVADPAPTWAGCYVGGNLGGLRGGDHNDFSFISLFAPDLFSNPATTAPFSHSYNANSWGVTGGIEAGCNYQSGRLVWGFEADFNGASRVSTSNSYGPIGPFPPFLDFTSSRTETVTQDLDWFSTVRGRLGTTFGKVLLYGTGGLAVARVNSSTNIAFGTDQFFLAGNGFQGSYAMVRPGWVAGVGLEWQVVSKWSLKAEYLHLDFGSFSYQSACVSATCNPIAALVWTTSVRAHDDIVRIGANYKLN
jgi:outer membrane immunogenic protein